jgi:hypothetical protein
MSIEKLAKRYCEYKQRIGHLYHSPEVLKKQYEQSNQVLILKREFNEWFGVSDVELGGEVARLVFLASEWRKEARSLIEQVHSEGIEASVDMLKQYATGNKPSKWIKKVIAHPDQMSIFLQAEWVIATYDNPATWIKEETIGAAA